jgi:ComF family protein
LTVPRALLAALVDLLYPPSCAACGEGLSSSDDEPFCPVCREAVEPAARACARCGQPDAGEPCQACLADPPPFESCSAAALLGGPLADAVHALKYRDRPALARPLGVWLASRVPLPNGAVVVPVPLARGRRRARGYDQAALLARWMVASAARRHPPGPRLLTAALRRVRETRPQVGRTRSERLQGVRGAFAASGAVRGRRVLLLDDVVTTGATAAACTEALLEAGAAGVSVVALARAE